MYLNTLLYQPSLYVRIIKQLFGRVPFGSSLMFVLKHKKKSYNPVITLRSN